MYSIYGSEHILKKAKKVLRNSMNDPRLNVLGLHVSFFVKSKIDHVNHQLKMSATHYH